MKKGDRERSILQGENRGKEWTINLWQNKGVTVNNEGWRKEEKKGKEEPKRTDHQMNRGF